MGDVPATTVDPTKTNASATGTPAPGASAADVSPADNETPENETPEKPTTKTPARNVAHFSFSDFDKNSVRDNFRIAPPGPNLNPVLHPEYSPQAFQSGLTPAPGRTQAAKIGLSAPAPTNVAQQSFTGGRPGSFAWHLAQTAPLIPSLVQRFGAPTALLLASTTTIGAASNPAQEPPTPPSVPTTAPPAFGSTGPLAGITNADQTQPTTSIPGPDRAQAAQRVVDRFFAPFAGQRGALGGAGSVAKASLALSDADRLATAHANAEMIHEQLLAHKMGEDGILAAMADGKAGFAAIQSGRIPGTVLATNKTSDDIKAMLKSGAFNASTDTAFLTGRIPVGTDTNGAPMYRSTYNVVRLSSTPIELSDKDAQFINDHLPDQKLQGRVEDKNGKVTQHGQMITPAQLNWLWQQASNTARVNDMRDEELAAWNLKKEKVTADVEAANLASKSFMSDLLQRNKVTYFDKDGTMHYDPVGLVKAYMDGLGAGPGTDIYEQTGGKFAELFPKWVGEDRFKTIMGYYEKLVEKNETVRGDLTTDRAKAAKEPAAAIPAANSLLRSIGAMPDQPHGSWNMAKSVLANPKASAEDKAKAQAVIDAAQPDYDNAQETIKVAKEAQNIVVTEAGKKTAAEAEAKTKVEGNVNLTGEEYLASLPAGERDLVKSIGTGHTALERVSLLLARNPKLGAEVARAYPPDSPFAFDSSKAAAYPQMYRDFTSTKPNSSGAALNAGATALKHLNQLSLLNTDKSRIPGTTDYNAYHNKLDTVVGELAMFYQLPKDDTSMQMMKSTLGAFLNREAAIKTQIESMGNKFDSYEQSWKNGMPSKLYSPPMPQVDDEAKAVRAKYDPNYAARLRQEKANATKATATEAGGPIVTNKVDLNVTPPPTPTSHVFDSKAWAAANPGKDVNKAIAQAKAKGYEVR